MIVECMLTLLVVEGVKSSCEGLVFSDHTQCKEAGPLSWDCGAGLHVRCSDFLEETNVVISYDCNNSIYEPRGPPLFNHVDVDHLSFDLSNCDYLVHHSILAWQPVSPEVNLHVDHIDPVPLQLDDGTPFTRLTDSETWFIHFSRNPTYPRENISSILRFICSNVEVPPDMIELENMRISEQDAYLLSEVESVVLTNIEGPAFADIFLNGTGSVWFYNCSIEVPEGGFNIRASHRHSRHITFGDDDLNSVPQFKVLEGDDGLSAFPILLSLGQNKETLKLDSILKVSMDRIDLSNFTAFMEHGTRLKTSVSIKVDVTFSRLDLIVKEMISPALLFYLFNGLNFGNWSHRLDEEKGIHGKLYERPELDFIRQLQALFQNSVSWTLRRYDWFHVDFHCSTLPAYYLTSILSVKVGEDSERDDRLLFHDLFPCPDELFDGWRHEMNLSLSPKASSSPLVCILVSVFLITLLAALFVCKKCRKWLTSKYALIDSV